MRSTILRVSLSCLLLTAACATGQAACWTKYAGCGCCYPCECYSCRPLCGEWVPVVVTDCGCNESVSCNACEAETPVKPEKAVAPTETNKAIEPEPPMVAPALEEKPTPTTEEAPTEQPTQTPAEVTPPPAEATSVEPVVTEPAEILPPGPAETTSPQSAGEPAAATPHPADIFVEPSRESTPEAAPAGSPKPTVEETPAPTEETEEQPAEPSTKKPSFEDIFGEPTPPTDATEEEPTTEKPQEEKEQPKEDAEKKEVDPFDPFSRIEAPVRENLAGLVRADSRLWTARFSQTTRQGSLVGATRDAIVLQQGDGTLWKVTYRNLSRTDLQYLRDQVRWQRALQAQPEAGTQLAVGWSR